MLKSDLNTSMLVKLRNGGITIVAENMHKELSLVLSTGNYYSLYDYTNYLFKHHDNNNNNPSDIMAVKNYLSPTSALQSMLTDRPSDLKWDWIREEKSDKEVELENLINTLNTQLEEAKTKLKEITNKS
jgi:predicted RNase H-like nuclease (RuvC/YqgF family)